MKNRLEELRRRLGLKQDLAESGGLEADDKFFGERAV